MRKIITIRENLIREIEESGKDYLDISEGANIFIDELEDYLNVCESNLNGAEIQRIFNYLNENK
jgi:hypothetical protein